MAASLKPYSLRTAAFVGSAASGSTLICGEPCICQPPNCWGRMDGALVSAGPEAGAAAKPALATRIATVRAIRAREGVIANLAVSRIPLVIRPQREEKSSA